jgi:hypothetical protein
VAWRRWKTQATEDFSRKKLEIRPNSDSLKINSRS